MAGRWKDKTKSETRLHRLNSLHPFSRYDKFRFIVHEPGFNARIISIGIRRYDIYDVTNGHPLPVSFHPPHARISSSPPLSPSQLSRSLSFLLTLARIPLRSSPPPSLPPHIPFIPRYSQCRRGIEEKPSSSNGGRDSPLFFFVFPSIPEILFSFLFFFEKEAALT